MRHTSFICGIFYDNFAPGGLRASNMGSVSTYGDNGEGAFLIDVRSKRAEIPLDAAGRPARICMTLILDVAKFMIAAMDIPLHQWPREFRMRGERIDLSSLVRVAETLRGESTTRAASRFCDVWHGSRGSGESFERREYTPNALQSQLDLAKVEQNAAEEVKINKMMAAGAGAYDFNDANLNARVNVEASRFEDWLSIVWHGYI